MTVENKQILSEHKMYKIHVVSPGCGMMNLRDGNELMALRSSELLFPIGIVITCTPNISNGFTAYVKIFLDLELRLSDKISVDKLFRHQLEISAVFPPKFCFYKYF